jgi:formylglycine-generating enzyme required for sulfatase activity
MLAQFLIAIVAFVFVRDYMSNGYIKNAVANVLSQAAGANTENGKTKTDQVVVVAVNPPPVIGTETEQDAELKQETPKAVETELAPPAGTQIAATPVALKPAPQIKVEAAPPPVEPVPQAEVQAAPPPVEPEPAPQIEEQATEAAAVPDLTPLKDASVVTAEPELSDSQQKEGLMFRDCDYCPELVSVAPGQYMVGSGGVGVAQQSLAAAEAQEVTVNEAFAIGRNEITFEDWERCVSAGGCNSPPSDDGWGRGRRPVIHVSYIDITEQYLPWLSKVTGYAYRLPTEAEWELASQGGNTSSRGQTLEASAKAQVACSYGNSSDVAAKTRESIWAGVGCNDGFLYTAPAGSLSANSLGIFDMHGNVWEWVSDCWHATYASEEEKNSPVCKYHVLRGGSWASEFRFLPDGVWVGDAVAYRSAVRGWETSVKARNSIGFRVARSQP